MVLRPAGKVVYLIANGRASQRQVETGLKQDGLQEIVKGLASGEVIATDGAGFLSDGAAVTLATPRSAEARAASKKGPVP